MGRQLPATLEARYDELIHRLAQTAAATGRKPPRPGRDHSHMACCPVHDDRNPSLSLRYVPGDKILVHCFVGCAHEDITEAVGIPTEALFEGYGHHDDTPWPTLGKKRLNGAHGANGKTRPHSPAETLRQQAQEWATSLFEPVERLQLPPTIREFLDSDFPEINPLIGPIATQQIVMLYAPPGVGKTMFALALSHAMAAGRDFLGWTAAKRARVLVVDGEMVGEMMQQRLAGAGLEDDWLRIANLASWGATNGYDDPINLATEEGQELVELWCNAAGTDVLVLDNLMSLAWMDGISMSSDEFWQPVRRFSSRQRAAGRTVIIVDHTNASGEIFGTKTKLWHADLAIQLSPAEGQNLGDDGLSLAVPETRFRLEFKKVRGTPDSSGTVTSEKVVTLGKVGQDWKWTAGRTERRELAREMKVNGLSIRDIAEEIGESKSTVGRWCRGI